MSASRFVNYLISSSLVCLVSYLSVSRSAAQLQVGSLQNPNLFRYDTSFMDEQLATRPLNITELLVSRFHYLFKKFPIKNEDSSTNFTGQDQSALEDRKIDQLALNQIDAPQRRYFRIMDKVFSRVTLPETFRSSKSKSGAHCGLHIGCIEELPNFPALLKKSNVTSTFTLYSADRSTRSGLRIKYEPLTHYQLQDINTSEIELGEKLRSLQRANLAAAIQQTALILKGNRRIPINYSANGVARLVGPKQQRLHQLMSQPLRAQQRESRSRSSQKLTASSWRAATKIAHSQEYPFDLAALEQSGFNSSLNTRIIIGGYFAKEDEEWIDEVVRQWLLLEPQSNVIKVSWPEANRGLYHTAAYNSRVIGRQMSLFIHYLDQLFGIDLNKFHLVGHSLGAHIAGFVGSDYDGHLARITGLDPAGPIFVELNSSMRLDPTDAKFVDVMHTNGGPITRGSLGLSIPSGHVDYYCNGGSVQPGCYFSSVTKSIMDPVERIACSHRRSYRYFIEIIKMTIKASSESLDSDSQSPGANSTTNFSENYPHVDDDGADNRLVAARRQLDCDDDTCVREHQQEATSVRLLTSISRLLPSAFLFEAKQDDLVRLVQPEITLMRRAEWSSDSNDDQQPPARRHIEFHSLSPAFPAGKRGTYFFKTRAESPFFATKQYALTLRTDSVVRRKIALSAKINQTLIAEVELDEIPGSYALIFAPNDIKPNNLGAIATIDFNSPPPIQLMWKYRSFNLLLNQQNDLHLTSLELSPLEPLEDQTELSPNPTLRYSSAGSNQTPSTVELPVIDGISSLIGQPPQLQPLSPGAPGFPLSQSTLLKGGLLSGHLSLTRNQWHKFEGKLVRS